ncbi:hypothetical protein [Streptomyces resistomycificus]|nr:hypothetical protein [Streptomyces resistomycificus]
MGADRETNHDMANSDITDIAVLLADATDEVEIGIAPYDAVLRGGRRRRARRWAVATATALVLAASSATLAVAGLPGGGEGRVTPAATQPSVTASADVSLPQRTMLATGTENGRKWHVLIDVWAAPRDEGEAMAQMAQMAEMAEFGVTPPEAEASQLVGKSSFFVNRGDGDTGSTVMEDVFTGVDHTMAGTDIESAAMALRGGSDAPQRLVVGQVAKTARQVTCTWKDGTTTKVNKPAPNEEVSTETPAIRTAEGSPVNWFVCLAPKGTEYKSVEVTR